MKLLKNGRNISVSIENITPFGIWMLVKDKEYFLKYSEYPYFENQTIKSPPIFGEVKSVKIPLLLSNLRSAWMMT